jgi:hypothetical protein
MQETQKQFRWWVLRCTERESMLCVVLGDSNDQEPSTAKTLCISSLKMLSYSYTTLQHQVMLCQEFLFVHHIQLYTVTWL